jgi:DNA-binding response OmpR family regulator
MRILMLGGNGFEFDFIEKSLESAGYRASRVGNWRLMMNQLENVKVDLLILDWERAELPGVEILNWVRVHVGTHLPVLAVTRFDNDDDISTSMSAGADDFIVKPLRRYEIIARTKALLNRAFSDGRCEMSCITVGHYLVDTRKRVITVDGRQLPLTAREFDLASLMFRYCGRICSREVLYKTVWGKSASGDSRTLDTYIYRLRKKLELSSKNGARLRAVYQRGYCIDEVTEDGPEFQ